MNRHEEEIKKKTCTIKELGYMLGISEAKARQLSRMDGFPLLTFGRNKRVYLPKLDEFLEKLLED